MNLLRKKSISKILEDSSWSEERHPKLLRNLSVIDLTALGIAAIIGAGIFSTIGNASANGGPAVTLLFVFTAIACSFSAMCYAEFASKIPISGSAYTYAYASLGELIAWIIGWDLLMEYSVGNIAVAISWSDYFTGFLNGFGIHFPSYLSMDYLSASRGFKEVSALITQGNDINTIPQYLQQAYNTWLSAPQIAGLRIIADIPAFGIVVLITVLVFIGIKESKITANLMVLLKVIVILLIIAVGSFYVKPENWTPFAPNSVEGVLKGVAAVFFAYIGFDAISTTAEECRNPRKDLPRAMIFSLLICTVLYVLVTLVLTGMVSYKELAVGDPLAFVFHKLGLSWLSGIVSLSAIIAMAGVLLVFQIGQPRIWLSMSRDGLLPQRFSKIHPRFKTPSFSTIITGLIVALPSLFLNITEVTDLTSIGTLFAFVIVCAGVLAIRENQQPTDGSQSRHGGSSQNSNIQHPTSNIQQSRFKIPYINSRYIIFVLLIIIPILVYLINKQGFMNFFDFSSFSDWDITKHKIPMIVFILITFVVTILAIIKKYSLIPVLGLLTNLYLMTELGITNWLRFLSWLVIGLILYFTYGVRKSKLNEK